MTEADGFVVENFESKLSRLMQAYTQLKDENRVLRATIDSQSVELDQLREQYASLTQSYTDLKLAKIIGMGDSDIESAQQRLSKLVREVDRCIALLNAAEQKDDRL